MTTEVPDEYISGRILKEPKRGDGKIIKGAIILSQLDYIIQNFPTIRNYFYTTERRAWRGLNESVYADIKLVEDLSFWDETHEKFPNAICLDIGPADFVDTDSFYPTSKNKKYDGIQISSWDAFKRPFLFVSACALLPQMNFVKIGHFVRGGNLEEISTRDQCLELTKRLGANISYPYANLDNNHLMPKSKEEINHLINSASIGILTSNVEGINRFKMECLSADIPFLVAEDAACPTKKHINKSTGMLFEPTSEGLARAIKELNSKIGSMNPREYILKNTGKKVSLGKLRDALRKLSERDNQEFHFGDIGWDGRNESLLWGRENLFPEIEKFLNKAALLEYGP